MANLSTKTFSITLKPFCFFCCLTILLSSESFSRRNADDLRSGYSKHTVRKQRKADKRLENKARKDAAKNRKAAKNFKKEDGKKKRKVRQRPAVQQEQRFQRLKQPAQYAKLRRPRRCFDTLTPVRKRKRPRVSSNQGFYDPETPLYIREKLFYLRDKPFALRLHAGRRR